MSSGPDPYAHLFATPPAAPPQSKADPYAHLFTTPAPAKPPATSPVKPEDTVLGVLPGIARGIARVTAPVIGEMQNVGGAITKWAATSDVGRALSTKTGQAVVKAVKGAWGKAWTTVNQADAKGAKGIENTLTGGAGYEHIMLRQGMDPVGAKVNAALLRGIMDPSTLLAAPGIVSKALTIGTKIAGVTIDLARASGMTEPVAKAVGAAGKALLQHPITGPKIQQAAEQIANATRIVNFALNKYAGTPPELRRAVNDYYAGLRIEVGDALHNQAEIHALPLSPGDRTLITNVIEGVAPAEALPQRLREPYERMLAMGDEVTQRALREGLLDQARENYIEHLYGPQAMAAIRARSMLPEDVAYAQSGRAAQDALTRFQGRVQGESFGPLQQLAINRQRETLAQRYARTAEDTTPRRGPTTPQFEREYREANIAATTPTEGLRGVYGRQVVPGGARQVSDRINRARVFNTIEDAKAAGLTDVIEDPAVLLPMKRLQVGLESIKRQFYKKIVQLGYPWVGDAHAADMGKGYVPMGTLIGSHRVAERMGWDTLHVHPRVADVVRGLSGLGGNHGFLRAMAALNMPQEWLKRIIFLTPAVHGANQARAAWLSEGWNIFNPRYWKDALAYAADAREMGPITRRRLVAGGSLTGGISGLLRETINTIINNPAARTVLRNSGTWQEEFGGIGRRAATAAREVLKERKGLQALPGVGKVSAYLHALNDEILWNVADAGGRNAAFMRAVRELDPYVQREQMTQEAADEAAARYADLVWNDYSKEHYGAAEQTLNALMFVYSWTRGRAKLFGALGRSYFPGVPAGEARLYQQMATRWAVANVILPHIYRAWIDKQAAAFEAASVPVATMTNPYTRQPEPIYIKPSGWYDDAFQMLRDPVAFAWVRSNPSFRSLIDFGGALNQAYSEGRNLTDAVIGAGAQATRNIYPAGVPQMFRPGAPLWMRIAPALGIPATTVPPPTEDPKMILQRKLDNGDWLAAGAWTRQNHLSVTQILHTIPPEGRRLFMRGYYRFGRGVSLPRASR